VRETAHEAPLAAPTVRGVGSARAPLMFEGPDAGNPRRMLRKAMWTGLYAGIGAAATIAARRVASKIWRIATGEEPPTKK
jgi:hypothetical protein